MQQSEKRGQRAVVENMISAFRTVASNIAKSPHSLLANTVVRGREKADKVRHCVSLNDDLCMVSGPRCNVGESPSSFELCDRDVEYPIRLADRNQRT